VQASQVLGFGFGGALVAIVGTGGALLADAATFAVSAAAVRFVLQHRPAVGEAHGGLLRETLRGASTVRRSPDLRYWLAWGLLLAAAAAAPEGLAVALSDAYGGGARSRPGCSPRPGRWASYWARWWSCGCRLIDGCACCRGEASSPSPRSS